MATKTADVGIYGGLLRALALAPDHAAGLVLREQSERDLQAALRALLVAVVPSILGVTALMSAQAACPMERLRADGASEHGRCGDLGCP